MLQCRFLTIRIFWPSEFCKISPQSPRDGISESLDSKIFALAYALDPLKNSCIYGAQLVPLALPLGGPSKILNRGALDITLRHCCIHNARSSLVWFKIYTYGSKNSLVLWTILLFFCAHYWYNSFDLIRAFTVYHNSINRSIIILHESNIGWPPYLKPIIFIMSPWRYGVENPPPKRHLFSSTTLLYFNKEKS
jgi:hypothetical protein